MKLFQAGIYTSNFNKKGRVYSRLDDTEKWMRNSVENYLESYHYIHSPRQVERIRAEGVKVFLDSGAFSAFTQGVEIDIGEYCDYIHENQDIILFPSVLDAIGDAEGTWRNQEDMERRGVRPLPCFHYGEPLDLLRHYVANYEYITIGGMVPISTQQLKIWLDDIWRDVLCDELGRPRIKVHGFGLTSLPLMMRYPWYSVDSSTWVQWAANGMILIPTRTGQLDVSNKSSRRKIPNQHLDSISLTETKAIEDEIRSFCVDPDRLREYYYSRWAWNAWAFPWFAKDKVWEGDYFKAETQGFF
jgi:hypothetical protein